MNTNELKFAYKVRHALNENIDHLPASTTEKLASARKAAISRKKKESPLRVFAARTAIAGHAGRFFSEPLSWISRMGLAVPVLVLVAGLTGIYQYEQERRIKDIAEMDAEMLTDELPLSAYLDRGFNAYLASGDN